MIDIKEIQRRFDHLFATETRESFQEWLKLKRYTSPPSPIDAGRGEVSLDKLTYSVFDLASAYNAGVELSGGFDNWFSGFTPNPKSTPTLTASPVEKETEGWTTHSAEPGMTMQEVCDILEWPSKNGWIYTTIDDGDEWCWVHRSHLPTLIKTPDLLILYQNENK